MEFWEFTEYVKTHLPEYLGDKNEEHGYHIITKQRTNGVKKTGISVTGDKDAVPTIFLDRFYKMLQVGERPEKILRSIADVYLGSLQDVPKIKDSCFSFEACRDKITAILRRREGNEALYRDAPCEIKEDLVMVYQISLGFPNGSGTAIIGKDALEFWGIDEETLKKTAWENMKRENRPVLVLLGEVRQGIPPMNCTEVCKAEENVIYIVTSLKAHEGAVYLFDEEFMKEVSEKFGSDMIVIPSSVHEIMLLKGNDERMIERCRCVLREANEMPEVVKKKDVLSDNIYLFRYDSQSLELQEENGPEMFFGMQM